MSARSLDGQRRSADGKAVDQVTVDQEVIPAVPVEVWAATLRASAPAAHDPIAPPAGALPGAAGRYRADDTLAPPLAGVRAYMRPIPMTASSSACRRRRARRRAAWALDGAIPTYVATDGLLHYWPSHAGRARSR
jgi:hypothetical protein